MKRFDAKYVGPDYPPVSGAEMFGKLVVTGTQTPESGSVNYAYPGGWVGGAKSDMFGYVIIGEGTTTNGFITGRTTGGGTGFVMGETRLRFWKSDERTEASFLSLANKIPVTRPYVFTNGSDADTWLKSHGFYSSFGEADTVRMLNVSIMWNTRSDAANDSSPGTTVYQETGYRISEYTHLYTQADYSNNVPSGSFFMGDSNAGNYYKITPQGGGNFYTCRISTSGALTEFALGYNSYP